VLLQEIGDMDSFVKLNLENIYQQFGHGDTLKIILVI